MSRISARMTDGRSRRTEGTEELKNDRRRDRRSDRRRGRRNSSRDVCCIAEDGGRK
ncbi:hypothetical protein HNQ56_000591 [Anaerotaenia torta]|uniref:hypothetical protein n=1 Tax=Anaerotaenia torta TaxID=433293 RepID=UPI003D1A9C27